MILIITFKEDYTVDFIINKLNKRNISYKRLNCEDILNLPYSIQFGADDRFNLMGVGKFEAVWFRRTKLPELGNIQPAEKIYLLGEIEAFIQNLFCTIKSNWVSEPFFVYRAENKFLQLQEAKNLGFLIPETIITNDQRELQNFYSHHKGQIIVKPIARSRVDYSEEPQFIFTSLVTSDIMDKLQEHDLTPCIFQQAIEKEHELRITVVGDQVFPAVVFSQDDPQTRIDWRRKKLNFQAIDIPVEISDKCVQLVKALNLKFGAIDIIKDNKGDYIFLEINPNGQWAWIEMQTGLPIADAIIEILTC